MNRQKIVEWFFTFSEYVVAFVINLVYTFILTAPLFLVDLTIQEEITKIPLLFLPLVTLYGMALKGLVYAYHSVYRLKKQYYSPYFWRAIKDNFIKDYLYYLALFTIMYFSVTSTFFLVQNVNKFFYALLLILLFMFLSIFTYSTMQFALYEDNSLANVLKNSVILMIMYAVLSIASSIVLGYFIFTFRFKTKFVLVFGFPIYAGIILMIQNLIEIKQRPPDYINKER